MEKSARIVVVSLAILVMASVSIRSQAQTWEQKYESRPRISIPSTSRLDTNLTMKDFKLDESLVSPVLLIPPPDFETPHQHPHHHEQQVCHTYWHKDSSGVSYPKTYCHKK